MFEPHVLAALAVLFFVCAFVQGVIGFAFALLALPLMLALGLSLPQAVLTVTIGASVQMGWATFAMRDSISWRRLAPVCIMGMLTTPIGIWLLQFVSTQGTSIVRQVMGGIILLVVTAWWTVRPKPREKLGWGWDLLAGGISGVMGGLASLAGTSLIVWTHAHKWTNQECRVAPVATMFPRSLLQIGLMLAMTPGEELGSAVPSALLMVPGTILGAILGVRFGHRLSVPLLRVLVSLALVIMGVSSLLGPFL